MMLSLLTLASPPTILPLPLPTLIATDVRVGHFHTAWSGEHTPTSPSVVLEGKPPPASH